MTKWIVRLYAVLLLCYTGYRTVNFVLHQLPDSPFAIVIAIIFLFASEIGLLLWHELSINHTTTETQRLTSVAMTWINFLASFSMGIADMIITQTIITFVFPYWFGLLLIIGLPILMALNVAATIIFFNADKDVMTKVTMNEVKFAIHDEAFKELRAQKTEIAAQIKNILAAGYIEEVKRAYLPKGETPPVPQLQPEEATFTDTTSDMPYVFSCKGCGKIQKAKSPLKKYCDQACKQSAYQRRNQQE